MLYATAARASEVLALDVEDLDVGRKRAAIRGKGGHREIIWDAATARLLPRYLAGRRPRAALCDHGPASTSFRPSWIEAPTAGKGCPTIRAWSLFREASGRAMDTAGQLRHSALTHLGEDGVSAPLLMAKSRHRDLRTLSRYVRPGTKAVAQLTADARPGKAWQASTPLELSRNGMISENTSFSFHCYSDPVS